jgi:hypothetical protein
MGGFWSRCSLLRASVLAMAKRLPCSVVLSFGEMTKAFSTLLCLLIDFQDLFSNTFSDDCTTIAATLLGHFVYAFDDLLVFKERDCLFCHGL